MLILTEFRRIFGRGYPLSLAGCESMGATCEKKMYNWLTFLMAQFTILHIFLSISHMSGVHSTPSVWSLHQMNCLHKFFIIIRNDDATHRHWNRWHLTFSFCSSQVGLAITKNCFCIFFIPWRGLIAGGFTSHSGNIYISNFHNPE